MVKNNKGKEEKEKPENQKGWQWGDILTQQNLGAGEETETKGDAKKPKSLKWEDPEMRIQHFLLQTEVIFAPRVPENTLDPSFPNPRGSIFPELQQNPGLPRWRLPPISYHCPDQERLSH